jgi:hypothetical protein
MPDMIPVDRHQLAMEGIDVCMLRPFDRALGFVCQRRGEALCPVPFKIEMPYSHAYCPAGVTT